MPSKIKNAIAAGDVNVGFSAALRNAPLPEEKLAFTLNYSDIGSRANVGGYQFYTGNTPWLGDLSDILGANNVRLGHTDSNSNDVEAKLNQVVRGMIIRWVIDNNNFISWTISTAVRARNNEHEISLILKEDGITNLTSVRTTRAIAVSFEFYAVELIPETEPPRIGLFDIFRWQPATYVDPTAVVNPGDFEISANNREVRHLTNDNVESAEVIGIEYENGTELAQFVNTLTEGSGLIIYRDNQNVVKYNIDKAASQTAGSNLFRRLDVSYVAHILSAEGLDATGVDIPVHLGRSSGSVGISGGGGSMVGVADSLTSRKRLDFGTWVDIIDVDIAASASGKAFVVDAYFSVETNVRRIGAERYSARLVSGSTVIAYIGAETEFANIGEGGEIEEPAHLRGVFFPGNTSSQKIKLQLSSGVQSIYTLFNNVAPLYISVIDTSSFEEKSNRFTISVDDDPPDLRDPPLRTTADLPRTAAIVGFGDTFWIPYYYSSSREPTRPYAYAYNRDGSRKSSDDFRLSGTGYSIFGAATDGTTIWFIVRYSSSDWRLDGYDISSGSRSSSKSISNLRTLFGSSTSVNFYSLCYANGTLWLIESYLSSSTGDWARAIQTSNLSRNRSMDISLTRIPSASSITYAASVTDGTTLWIYQVEGVSRAEYPSGTAERGTAYNISSRTRDEDKDFFVNILNSGTGPFPHGATMISEYDAYASPGTNIVVQEI